VRRVQIIWKAAPPLRGRCLLTMPSCVTITSVPTTLTAPPRRAFGRCPPCIRSDRLFLV